MKVGLVLEGGAMRGMFTCGVIDTFLEQEIAFDGIVGVSAGALFGVNYVSGQKGRALRYNKKFNGMPNYMGVRPLLKEGNIVNTEFAYEKVPRSLDPFDNEAYMASPVDFYAVMTDVFTGRPVYEKITDVFEQMDTLRASGSMPMVSKPVPIKGRQYLDGGISDSIPYKWMADQGYDKIVVVLTRDINYEKKPFSKAMAKVFLRKYPKIAECMLKRHEEYNRSIANLRVLEKEGKVFVLRPSSPITISKMEKDPDKLQQVYDLGCRDCKKQLEALKVFLNA